MEAKSNFWFIDETDVLDVLCSKEEMALGDRHPHHLFNKDAFVYFEDEPSEAIYLVVSGRVKVGSYTEDGREITKAILSKGEMFGEMALVGEEKRNEFAQAMEDGTELCVFGVDELRARMMENKDFSVKIFQIIGLKIKKLERKVESLVFKDSRARVVDFLKELAVEKGKKVGFEVMVKNYLTHKDIAALTGTSRQTVTTILNELKEKNIINFNRRQFLIRDMNLLA